LPVILPLNNERLLAGQEMCPSRRIRPSVRISLPAIRSISVVLPPPSGTRIPVLWPSTTVRLKLRIGQTTSCLFLRDL
jgi:hypothetical protein